MAAAPSLLVTAIDGKADIIVSEDDDLRADDGLRAAMAARGIQLLGVNSFLSRLVEIGKDFPTL